MKKPIIIGLAGLCLTIGVGGYMLAGASVYSQAPAVQSNHDPAQSPFQVERKTGAAVYADLEPSSDDVASEAEAPSGGPKKLLGALLSGGAEMTKSRSYEPGESRFKKVGTFVASCSTGGGAKRCSTSE
ncbi:hypothetical protein [Neptunicoccus cionae]|uniref:hypothetical protein n=1 Tax=Neptunicoccus cionae TaxID=2035344 RepID=UPI000CBED1E5|nr:hypothetical protein [Amylibacter cionae]PLS23171.1 hypothetical protein C0U40_03270 [Amylibacter cionae]